LLLDEFILFLEYRVMDFLDLHKLTDKKLLKAGKLLIAQPFMADETFSRSVVFVCEHTDKGSIGFVINSPTDINLGDLMPEFYMDGLNVFHGGPVQLDTLHILHRSPEILGGIEVANGIFWGGSFDKLQESISLGIMTLKDIRLFVGYSGWSQGQLENELREKSWLISNSAQALLFDTTIEAIWKTAVEGLGDEYKYLINLPVNPQHN
jgi:putative transcriptional regulator